MVLYICTLTYTAKGVSCFFLINTQGSPEPTFIISKKAHTFFYALVNLYLFYILSRMLLILFMFTIFSETVACIIWMLIITFILIGLFIILVSVVKRNFLSSTICYIVYCILILFLLVQSYQLVEVIYAISCLKNIEISAQPLATGNFDENFFTSLFSVGKQSLEHFATIDKYIDHYNISISDFASPQYVIETIKDKLYHFAGKQIAWIIGGMAISYVVILIFVMDDSYSNVHSMPQRRDRERINRRRR